MYKYFVQLFLVANISYVFGDETTCEKSLTTVSGTLAPKIVCADDLIFEDTFNTLNFKKWKHEITLSGGGNWEFQWYTNNRSNSYVKDGHLYIKPTLTADYIGEANLSKMTIDISGSTPGDYCTDSRFWGCNKTGNKKNILNPVRSAKLSTVNSFSFKYGKLQVKAKLPTGDWLWPAIWLLPLYNEYGTWPTSGVIDLMESRGNENLIQNGEYIGVQQVRSTIYWGPSPNRRQYIKSHLNKNNDTFNKEFKVYEMNWTPDYMNFNIDGEDLGAIQPANNFSPFDQEFYIIMNLAVGGTNGFFPDDAKNTSPKPWKNTSPQAYTDFWNNKVSWLPTWKLDENKGESAALQVDYVRVWAL